MPRWRVPALPNPKRCDDKLDWATFWSCYTLGFLIRLPLVLWSGMLLRQRKEWGIFVRTHQPAPGIAERQADRPVSEWSAAEYVPLLFGELFTTVLYDGVAVDPGSPKMRRSLARHLRRLKPKITKIVATHAHEEHVGNLNWLSDLTGAPDLCFGDDGAVAHDRSRNFPGCAP